MYELGWHIEENIDWNRNFDPLPAKRKRRTVVAKRRGGGSDGADRNSYLPKSKQSNAPFSASARLLRSSGGGPSSSSLCPGGSSPAEPSHGGPLCTVPTACQEVTSLPPSPAGSPPQPQSQPQPQQPQLQPAEATKKPHHTDAPLNAGPSKIEAVPEMPDALLGPKDRAKVSEERECSVDRVQCQGAGNSSSEQSPAAAAETEDALDQVQGAQDTGAEASCALDPAPATAVDALATAPSDITDSHADSTAAPATSAVSTDMTRVISLRAATSSSTTAVSSASAAMHDMFSLDAEVIVHTQSGAAVGGGYSGSEGGAEATDTGPQEVPIKLRLNDKWFRSRASTIDAVIVYVKEKLLRQALDSIDRGGGSGQGEGKDGGGMLGFEMRYLDEQNDEISLDCEKDFQEAVNLMRGRGVDGRGGVDDPLKIFVTLSE